MGEPTNREIGQAWTAYMLGELFEAWPRQQQFDHEELEAETGIGPEHEKAAFFHDLAEWLRDNGLVQVKKWGIGGAYGVSLTQYGVAILGKDLGLQQEAAKEPIGSVLKRVAKGAASEAGRAAIAETMGTLIGATARALGS
ncbi:hypothetical protein KXS07_23655 [Inquilinus limosus]|uniref:hypothetical protein n=1 Tax=Inquilinus limosus TaxID=171674 RepID=UPI003F162B79